MIPGLRCPRGTRALVGRRQEAIRDELRGQCERESMGRRDRRCERCCEGQVNRTRSGLQQVADQEETVVGKVEEAWKGTHSEGWLGAGARF